MAWPGQQRGSGRGAGELGTHVQVQVVVQESEEGRAAAHSPLPLVGLLRHQPHVQVLQGRAGGIAERTWLRPRPGPRPPSPDHTLSGPAHLGAGPAPSTPLLPGPAFLGPAHSLCQSCPRRARAGGVFSSSCSWHPTAAPSPLRLLVLNLSRATRPSAEGCFSVRSRNALNREGTPRRTKRFRRQF